MIIQGILIIDFPESNNTDFVEFPLAYIVNYTIAHIVFPYSVEIRGEKEIRKNKKQSVCNYAIRLPYHFSAIVVSRG